MKHAGLFAAAAGLALAACADPSSAPPSPSSGPALAVTPASAEAEVIPGRFIVTLRDGVNPAGVAREHGVSPDYVYTHALNGFAGSISDAARAGLLRDARVTRVEQDGIARTTTTQSGATWGLDRIDARSGLDTSYSYTSTGSGVTAYIIDTGIDVGHSEFTGRLSVAYFDAFTDGTAGDDCNGHGTHVAGTVGGTTWGVAKAVTLVRVRVLDCGGSGSWSGVVAGIDWVVANHVTGPAVSNMSLGGGASESVDAAVDRMIDDGVASAVAAGNGNMAGIAQDACKYSPARVPRAMTIGATTKTDAKTSWSNYGSCVDWFAPGAGITSAWIGDGSTDTNTISGTSMATPHVAGVAALYLANHATATAQEVRDALYSFTTRGIVTSSKTTNNHLLYSFETVDGGSGGGGGEVTAPSDLKATGTTARNGRKSVELTWTKGSSANVDVYRNSIKVATTANDGTYTDGLGRTSGTFTYKVCSEGSTTSCSNDDTVTF